MHPIAHFKTITEHRHLVCRYCMRLGLIGQGLTHDLSKYSPAEFWRGAKYYQGYRSPNDQERRENGISLAWLHHKGRNRHHFEYWVDYHLTPDHRVSYTGHKMPMRYVAEMFCDRLAACRIYLKDQYTDQDVRNTLINLFNEGNSTSMMHLAEENRIAEAREAYQENMRRAAEYEMEQWAEAYHLTPEERETFEDYLYQVGEEISQLTNEQIQEINSIYFTAAMVNQYGNDSDLRIISTDEMTGIQALEHRYADKPCRPHQDAKTEFEYIRHGTTSLIGFFDVVTGKVIKPYLNKTRKADDFAEAMGALLDTDPDKYWVIVADNLNTHYSEQVVNLIADRCSITDLGEKGKSGPLKNLQSRINFLTDRTHRIRFAFTPKHCSWMNQIEIWFGIINRQLLKRKSFLSVSQLEKSILNFIDQYNSIFAKPFRWTYKTTPLG